MKNRKLTFLSVILCVIALCAAVIFASCGETTTNTPTETTVKIETNPVTDPVLTNDN